MNIIIFGPPGSGKGTQSEYLISKHGMLQISTGELLRSAIKEGSKLGKKAEEFMDKGFLVPDDIVSQMVEDYLAKGIRNFIFDGYPRTISQAIALEGLLKQIGQSVDAVIFLSVPDDILVGRLVNRRVCKECSTVYHISSKPSLVYGVCDKCGGDLIQRNDDRLEVIESRLVAYQDFTTPLKDFYKEVGKFVEVDGSKSAEEVSKEIEKIIK